MMFISLSGIVPWTRPHGPRVAAIGVLAAVMGAAVITLSGVWVTWAAP